MPVFSGMEGVVGAETGIGPERGSVFVQRKDLEGLEVPARTGKGLYLTCLWVTL